jgi:energy-coupling factor transporter ATP-binding protein EcfA2
MITHVQVLNYRAFRYLDVALGRRHVLVGPNGSGKSTLLDVVAFAADVMRHGPDTAVFGDDRLGLEPRVSDPRDLLTKGVGESFEIVLEAELPEELSQKLKAPQCRYELALTVPAEGGIGFRAETFWLKPASLPSQQRSQQEIFPSLAVVPPSLVRAPGAKSPPGWRKVANKVVESGNDYFRAEMSDWNNQFRLGPGKSALGNLPEDSDKFPAAMWFKRLVLEKAQRIALNSAKLRLPGPAGKFRGFLPDGSNLPNAVHALEQAHPERLENWLSEVRTAIPDIRAISTVERPEDRRRYLKAVYEGNVEIPSYTMSDGTLRLLALTLLPYLDELPSIVMIEEPENGIHPQAMETVYRALRDLSDTQVLCATHSPVLVNQADISEILCFAKTREGYSDVRQGSDHPRLKEWLGRVDQGTLFANGILS